ncbi:MAG: LysR family transcriptional regulator [Burkholderiaceae bacterium]|nr:LysR family transcriptional regulator [Burkholderiaceae bacterium]
MHKEKLLGLDLDLLVALDVLLETGSVSATASRLHRSQPAVSRMLGRARDVFGDPLFVPHGRGLAPTARALAIRGALKLTLSEVRHLVDPPRAFNPAQDAASFRLVSSDYAAVSLLGNVVSWLHQHAPRVHITLAPVTGRPDTLLASGEVDVLFGPQALCPPWCVSAPFIDDNWVCVRRRGEALPTTRKEYLAMSHIAVQIERAFGDQVEKALKGAQRRVQVTVPDFAAALFVVASSPLLATLPRPLVVAASKLMPLDWGEIPLKVAGSSIAMIWPRRLDGDPAQIWLRRAVLESIKATAPL